MWHSMGTEWLIMLMVMNLQGSQKFILIVCAKYFNVVLCLPSKSIFDCFAVTVSCFVQMMIFRVMYDKFKFVLFQFFIAVGSC